MERCILNPKKICDHCEACNRCDLDPTKLCDNCFRCLDMDKRDYASVEITDILTEVDASAFEDAPMRSIFFKDRIHVLTLFGVKGRRRK